MRIKTLFCFFGFFTVLYAQAPLQAQIQTKSFSVKNKQSSISESAPLFIRKNTNKKEDALPAMDEKQSKEIDRIFEKYKALSEQQALAANEKPMKDRTLNIEAKPSRNNPHESKTKPATKPAGIAGILDQYFQSKENRTKTNSLRFQTPKNLND